MRRWRPKSPESRCAPSPDPSQMRYGPEPARAAHSRASNEAAFLIANRASARANSELMAAKLYSSILSQVSFAEDRAMRLQPQPPTGRASQSQQPQQIAS